MTARVLQDMTHHIHDDLRFKLCTQEQCSCNSKSWKGHTMQLFQKLYAVADFARFKKLPS